MMPDKMDRYQIKRKLARGGFATVYLAYDNHFGREVALKVMNDAFLDDLEFHKRFERETKIVANLEHAAIVPVYDFGAYDGSPYLIMRYMPGGSLQDRLCKDGRLSLAEASRYCLRLGMALDEAHDKGIVHRDIKPANVLIDKDGLPYLSDFGLARLAEQSTNITKTGAVIGSFAYMAPEQWKGQEVSARTDVYQFGVMLFEMLTGQRPFTADEPSEHGLLHLNHPIPSARAINPDLPFGCDEILIKALAKEPAQRYETTGELAQALAECLEPKPILPLTAIADTISQPKSLVKDWSRVLVWSQLSLTILVILLVLLLFNNASTYIPIMETTLPTSSLKIEAVTTRIETVTNTSNSMRVIVPTTAPTKTPTSLPTDTPMLPPTHTLNPTISPTHTLTPTVSPTHTLMPTVSPTNTQTSIPVPQPVDTATNTPIPPPTQHPPPTQQPPLPTPTID